MADVFSLESYDYVLPEERIAQHPPKVRGTSRLMVLDRGTEGDCWTDTSFDRLPEFLPEKALLVVNNSRVIPARLFGRKPSGGRAEMLLLTPPVLLEKDARPESGSACRLEAEAEALLRPGRSIRAGDMLDFGELQAEVLKKGDFGRHTLRLFWKGNLTDILEKAGKLPLPPYIRREQDEDDISRYQTMYAREDKKGSVAAPTAGLHFTEKMRGRLLSRGVEWAEVTLHVGYGTFSPVREEDIRQHPMHAEYAEIPYETVEAVRRAKRDGRPVIAVGTTSARTLEGAAEACAREGKWLFSPEGISGSSPDSQFSSAQIFPADAGIGSCGAGAHTSGLCPCRGGGVSFLFLRRCHADTLKARFFHERESECLSRICLPA